MQSVKQPEYADINTTKKQMVSPKRPPCQKENLDATPNQESQELSPSKQGSDNENARQAGICITIYIDVEIKHVAMMQAIAWKSCMSNAY